jgi:hypothetical protein
VFPFCDFGIIYADSGKFGKYQEKLKLPLILLPKYHH